MKQDSITSKLKSSGGFYLLDPETVLSLYEKAGKDPDSDDENKQPDYVECIDGSHYLFTGWTVKKNGVDLEFVCKLDSTFTTAEIESIDFLQPEEDFDDEDFEDDDEEEEKK